MFYSIEQLNIPNLRRVSDTVFSGATLENRPYDLRALRNAGIASVVDFRGDATTLLQQECKNVGLDYLQLPLDHTLAVAKKAKTTAPDTQFIASLKKFFNIMDRGNAYVGCNYGIDRTNVGLSYNYFLNPKADIQKPPIILTWADSPDLKNTINRIVRTIKLSVKRMSDEQKNALTLTGSSKEIFDVIFKERIGKLIARNLRFIR